MKGRESPVSLFDCSYLLLRTVLNQRKQEEDVKIITAEGKKSHISAGMSTFSSNLCPFAPSCSTRKKLFTRENLYLHLWRYYFLVHASPHLHQKMGIKKSPLSVCLSLFWQSEKKIKHKDKKNMNKSSISPFSSSNCPRFAPSCTETSQAPVVVWDCEMQIQTAGKVRRNIQVLWKQPDLVNFVKFSPTCKIWPMLLNKVKL